MKLIINRHLTKKVNFKINSRNLKKSLTLKKILRLSIILIIILAINIPTLSKEFDKQTIDDHSFNELDLNSSNQTDQMFKFIYGTDSGPVSLDPHNAWDLNSYNVINQVCERLFYDNLSVPNTDISPNLANETGIWLINATDVWYTVSLRSDVFFHDGTKFNATAVKFSFDRLAYLMNITGTLPASTERTWISSVYLWPDSTPYINRTEIVDEFTIKFVLNKPFSAFPSLLCFSGSNILSPTSTNATGYINTLTGDLIGTGPFVYDEYIPGIEVKFHAFDDYWGGKAKIELLTFSIVSDPVQALLSGEVDLISDPSFDKLSILEADPNINVIDVGNGSTIYFIEMNNKLLNKTWREAISYAINYSQILDELWQGAYNRLRTPIPDVVLYANNTNNVATFDISYARSVMQSMGFGVGWDVNYPGTNETQWTSATFATDAFGAPIDLNLFSQSQRNPILNALLMNNLSKLGIDLDETVRTWLDFLEAGGSNPDELGLWFWDWEADSYDPFDIMNLFFHNESISNFAQVNDPYLQNLIDNGLIETNPTAREAIYNEIQRYLVEESMPWAFLSISRNFDAYFDYALGYQSNSFEWVSFYEISQNSTLFPGKIYLNGNQEWDYLKELGKCTGSGTSIDPYIIRDLVIDGGNRSQSGILIENSDVYIEIRNCTIFNSAGAGIEFNNVSNSKIIGNNCSNNSFGISLDKNSIGNEISANFINNNSQYGIFLNNVKNISGTILIIFNNTIIWNNINAYDSGPITDWDNGVIGNYWSDYDGVDEDNDGIGDTPYTIPGPSGKQDNFPLYDRYFVPSIEYFIPPDQIIKVGILGDPNHISCEHAWKGAFLAAKEINEAGGILINGTVFYIGLISQNTFEAEENLDITKGINAATNLISTYDPDFIIGGLKYNSVSAYLEPIMDAQIPFLPTTVSIDNFTQNVLDNYARYKYFFSHVQNTTEIARQLITFQIYLTSILSSTLSRSVNKIAILHDGQGLWPPFVEFMKTNFLPMYGLEIVKEIIFNQGTTKANFKDYWYEIDNAGAQLTFVGSYALDNLPLISEAYGEVKPRCLLFSSNIYNALDTYWSDTNEGCKYEVSYQVSFNISRTSRSIPFWNNFVNEYSHEPFYAAASAYDSIYLLENATLDSQSLDASKIVGSLEKINVSNPFPGISGKFAYTSSHAVFHGVGYGAEGYTSGIMCQWQSGGTKVVIPNYWDLIYPDSLATGNLQIPEWGINIHYTINSPNEDDIFTELPPAFNIEIIDPIDESWYILNSGSEKHFFNINESIDPTAWTNLPEGIVNLTFYANDSQGKIYSRYVTFIKDVSPPQVEIEPMETTTFGSEAPTITLNIQDVSGIKESYYSLDGGVTKIQFTGNEVTINQSIWDALGEGVVTITFYIIDVVDKETIVYIDIYKDLPGGPSGDNPFFYIIIGAITLCLGIVSTITYTQHRRKKRRKTEWVKLKKKKGLLSPELAEGKNLVFISYATKDSDLFQISLITDILIQYPEIDDILYWESDMHDDIYEYMDDNLKLCSIFLLFSTQNSLYSEPVKMEWRAALKLDKKVIPIFINPNDIPPLLTTKLGVQFNEDEVYDSIEGIYQMILTKLEIPSSREFCKYLIPKSVSEEYFDEQTAPMIKKDVIIESDIPANDLQMKLISILEKNNFEFLKKLMEDEETKELKGFAETPSETQLINLRFFVEDKFAKQEIGLSATIQKVEEYKSKIYLRIMGNKEWMIGEVLKDLNGKFYPLKTVTELLREYSEKIVNFMDQVDNLEEFLSINLGVEFRQIEDSLHQLSRKTIEKDEFIKKGLQLLGKQFILFFIENLPKTPYDKKKSEEQGEMIPTPL